MPSQTSPRPAARTLKGMPLVSRVDGARIASILRLAVDPASGRVAYALVASSGFLGLGRHLRALPWSLMAYDDERAAYLTPLTREELYIAPVIEPDEFDAWTDEAARDILRDYYAPFAARPSAG